MLWGEGVTLFFHAWKSSSLNNSPAGKGILLPLSCLGTLQKSNIDTWFYFQILKSIPQTFLSILMPVPHGLNYGSNAVKLQNCRKWVLELCYSFSRWFWLFRIPWLYVWVLGSAAPIASVECTRDATETVLSIYVYLGSMVVLHKINALNHAQGVSF